jgi:hypothetical protein
MASYIGRRKFLATLGGAGASGRSRRAQQAGSCQPTDEGARDRDLLYGRHDRHVAVGRPSDRRASLALLRGVFRRRGGPRVPAWRSGRGCNTTDRGEVITSFPIREPSALGSV